MRRGEDRGDAVFHGRLKRPTASERRVEGKGAVRAVVAWARCDSTARVGGERDRRGQRPLRMGGGAGSELGSGAERGGDGGLEFEHGQTAQE